MKTKTYNDVRKQEYLITFRGHGALSQTQTLTSCEIGVAAQAKSAAEYWCRSHKCPFAVYTVGPIPTIGEITGTVSVDVDAPYTVFMTDPHTGVRFGHDFRRKADAESFRNRCQDAGIHCRDIALVVWLKKNRKTVTK